MESTSCRHFASQTVEDELDRTNRSGRPPAARIASFDGPGFGFTGPQDPAPSRKSSDNSLAIGPNHIVELAGGRRAVYDKKGAVLWELEG